MATTRSNPIVADHAQRARCFRREIVTGNCAVVRLWTTPRCAVSVDVEGAFGKTIQGAPMPLVTSVLHVKMDFCSELYLQWELELYFEKYRLSLKKKYSR